MVKKRKPEPLAVHIQTTFEAEAIFSLRMPADLRDALARAAADDERSSAGLLKRILRQWLVDKGYMK